MKRRDFLHKGLALGAAALLPGAGFSASNLLPLASTAPAVEPLLPIWEAAEEILKRLLLASEQQLELVAEGNVTELIQHLGQRQQLWHKFELWEQQLAPHMGILPERRGCKSAEERQMIKVVANRCQELLEKIQKNNQICLTKTTEQKEELEKQPKDGTEFQITEMALKHMEFNTADRIMQHQTLLLILAFFCSKKPE
jgi:hypothetical protein